MLRDASRGTHPNHSPRTHQNFYAPKAHQQPRAGPSRPTLTASLILPAQHLLVPDRLSSVLGSCRRVRNMLFRRRLRLRKLAAEKIAHL